MVAASSRRIGRSTFAVAPLDSTMNANPGNRMILWVDAVGGFLVCPNNKVVIGQAIPSAGVDIAIQADISRRHASIYREGEGYLLSPAVATRVDGCEVRDAYSLTDGAVIELGSRVLMKFAKPHPLSSTARLSMLSHHRTEPAVDGILLMADSIVLGPRSNCHIVSSLWSRELVLFRRSGEWMFRVDDNFEIDGVSAQGPVRVLPGNRISGKDFSLTLESV